MYADRILDARFAMFHAAERGDVDKLAWLLDPPWWSRWFPCMKNFDVQGHLMFALAGALFGGQARVAEMALVRIRRQGGFVSDVVKMAMVQVVICRGPEVELAISFTLQWFRRRFGFYLTDAKYLVMHCIAGENRLNVLYICECACSLLSLDDSIHLLMYVLGERFSVFYPILVPKLLSLVSSSSGPPHRALPDDLYLWVYLWRWRDGGEYVEDMLQHAQQLDYSNLSARTLALWQDRWPLRMQQCRAWSTPRAAWVCAVYRGVCSRARLRATLPHSK